MKFDAFYLLASALFASCSMRAFAATDQIKTTVDGTIKPFMAQHKIAGMAVGIVVAGKSRVFNYGVASTKTKQPVNKETLFELGSISKTFTATLASYAQLQGLLSLQDPTSKYLPTLEGTKFGEVALLNLATHTPGGLPLQVPGDVHNNDELMQYLKTWKPAHAPGTYRTYANPGIGMLGFITAKSMGQDFVGLMQTRLFPALGLKNTYITVPSIRMHDYAQGYTKDDAPIRMSAGVLSSEAYGVKSTAGDMARYMQINMNMAHVDVPYQQAISATHTGYFQAGPMTQGLVWEQYPYPVALQSLLDGNSTTMIFHATPVSAINPPQAPRDDVWINKSGSTNGFSAYIAFVPSKRMGIVMLANKSLGIDERIKAAYAIMTSLAKQ